MVSSPKIGANDARRRWQNRIARLRLLRESIPASAELLKFYEAVLCFQSELAEHCTSIIDPSTPLRQQIDLDYVVSKAPAILDLAIKHGPAPLAQHARNLQQSNNLGDLLALAANSPRPELNPFDGFITRASLQPVAECLQLQLARDPNYIRSACPQCEGPPQLAILRPEGDGAGRWLLCSFCLHEWLFRRLICPWCSEEDREKLPRYSAEECSSVHVEACDTCKRYLKAVDMTVEGLAEPLVDEAAFAALDVWAIERGYSKITRNLIGF